MRRKFNISHQNIFVFLKALIRRIIRRQAEWSIGLYTGNSPVNFQPAIGIKNPVLTPKDVTDLKAHMIADPFMIWENGTWYMFFEVMNDFEAKGVISLATSDNGLNWQYQNIVLSEPFHLSYPYVFKQDDTYYMIPESHQKNSIRLYKAINFPNQWSFVKELLSGMGYVDSSILFYNQKWWLFTSLSSSDVLYLYFADDLLGSWTEHPKSPIVKNNPHIARPGGRVIAINGKIIRYAQDDKPFYGSQVKAFEITRLTLAAYEEREFEENPILRGGNEAWNRIGMHNIDPHQISDNKWIACVDGYKVHLSSCLLE